MNAFRPLILLVIALFIPAISHASTDFGITNYVGAQIGDATTFTTGAIYSYKDVTKTQTFFTASQTINRIEIPYPTPYATSSVNCYDIVLFSSLHGQNDTVNNVCYWVPSAFPFYFYNISDTVTGLIIYDGADLYNFKYAFYSGVIMNTDDEVIDSGRALAVQYCHDTCSDSFVNNEPVSTPTVPIQKNIEILNPTYGTTTATTTFTVQINFKTPFSIDFRPTTTRHYEIVDAVTGELNYSYNHTLSPNSSENVQITATTTTTQGSKYIRAMYLDSLGNTYSEVDEVFFNVATNTYYTATGLMTPRENPSGLTQIDCGTFEFGCQFQKAIVFLFKPSDNVLNKFSNLWQTIAEKKPFGYITVTINQLKNIDESGSAIFTLGTIPFMDSLFTPFRTAISTILWALFAIYFYRNRLIHLDI